MHSFSGYLLSASFAVINLSPEYNLLWSLFRLSSKSLNLGGCGPCNAQKEAVKAPLVFILLGATQAREPALRAPDFLHMRTRAVRNKGESSHSKAGAPVIKPLQGVSLQLTAPGATHLESRWQRGMMSGQRGVGGVKVPGEQISGLVAFWNFWDLWIQVNIHTWSQRRKGFPRPLLLMTGSARQVLRVRVSPRPANPPPCEHIRFAVQKHMANPFFLFFSVCLSISLSSIIYLHTHPEAFYIYKLMNTIIDTNIN